MNMASWSAGNEESGEKRKDRDESAEKVGKRSRWDASEMKANGGANPTNGHTVVKQEVSRMVKEQHRLCA